MSRYQSHTVGSGFKAHETLMEFLNALPASHRVVSIEAGRFGKWHGLDEEYEHGFRVIIDTGEPVVEHKIVWKNEHKNLGIVVKESNPNFVGLSYELRKGAMNTLGVVSSDFMDAWGDMTADDNCIVETIKIEVVS